MSITTLSSRAFNQDASGAKHAANDGPVIITDRGRPAHVLLSYAEYKKLTSQRTSMADLLSMPEGIDIEFESVRLTDPPRSVDLL
jgi:PHD/YefM family antitoxin component YafN of YafNO toxin-antitoxin module